MTQQPQGKLVFLPGVEGVQHLKLGELVLLKDAGFGDADIVASVRKLNKTYIAHLANTNEKEWPPIEVVHIRDTSQVGLNYSTVESYIIIDGMHRYHAAIKKHLLTLAAHVGSYNNEDDVVIAYLLANTKHGQPANTDARREAALMMYERDYTLSPEDISEVTGLSPLQVKHVIEGTLKNDSDETLSLFSEVLDNETTEQREARLLCLGLQRFFTNQQDKLKRFIDAADHEKEVSLIANELHAHYKSLKDRQQVLLAEALHAIIDVTTFMDANGLI